jgi:hypothetical protein
MPEVKMDRETLVSKWMNKLPGIFHHLTEFRADIDTLLQSEWDIFAVKLKNKIAQQPITHESIYGIIEAIRKGGAR